jgi:hypothetical protein
MSDITLTAEQETILRSQVFDATHPGAVLHDFQLVLDYVGEKGVKAGGKYNLLPIGAIPLLDPQFARPLGLALERPQLRSHPYLQGLHLLLRASTLARVEGKGKTARLVIDPTARASWDELNPTERYFALLEAWLVLSSPEMVGGDGRRFGSLLDEWSTLLRIVMGPSKQVDLRDRLPMMLFSHHGEFYNVALADLFGLITTDLASGTPEGFPWSNVQIMPFGDALFTLLANWSDEDEETEQDVDEEDESEEEGDTREFGFLQPLLQSYFPAYQQPLTVGALSPARKGVFVFKVSLGREVWRRIALAHDHTLDDLVTAILRSVKFDFDHLYEFRYRDALGRTTKAAHPYCDDEISADTVTVGTLPLRLGDSMELVYDFGDDWRFNVKLERIDPPGSLKKLPKVLESHGKAPKQYPSWD